MKKRWFNNVINYCISYTQLLTTSLYPPWLINNLTNSKCLEKKNDYYKKEGNDKIQ